MPKKKVAEPVTAKVLFDGLMLMCVTRDTRHRCELGFIKCREGKHLPTLTVETTPTGGGAVMMGIPIPITQDFYIKVVRPTSDEITKRHVPPSQSPLLSDFDFVIDIEGFKLHRDGVDLDTDKFFAKMAVTAGELFIDQTPKPGNFRLIEWTEDNPDGRDLGRFFPVEDSVGLAITCLDQPGAGLDIINAITHQRILWLPRLDGFTYTIRINNECLPNRKRDPAQIGTDFRMYYDEVVIPRDEIRYDIKKLVSGAGGDPSPDVCELGFLGKTYSLDFSHDTNFRPPLRAHKAKGQAPKRSHVTSQKKKRL